MTTDQRYFYGLGRRKSAVARVRLYPGNGTVVINGRPFEDVLPRESLRDEVMQPLVATDSAKNFNIQAKVQGGGVSGWAGAIRHGVARALVAADETNKRPLRAQGLLTRDPRVKERKKPGLKRARKAPQYTKR
ncbi:MAG: 30S ribosomal protein S9 [Dehalococcoidia bacterium]|jgi:small subunit ribosomal protein S9|nr:30S ribosomal protein S9 [Dehalococcoidia bacterium]